MESKNSYFLAGASFLLASIILVAFVLFMNSNHDEFSEEYLVRTGSLPAGVRKNSPVLSSGIPAGVVRDIYFVDKNQSTIEIKIGLKKNSPVSSDSVVQVITPLLGNQSTLNVTRGSGRAFDSGEFRIIKLQEDSFERLEISVLKITQKTEEALDKINKILGDENSGLVAFAGQIASKENSQNFKELLTNMKDFSETLKGVDMKGIQDELKMLSKDVRLTSLSIKSTADSIKNRLESGEFDFKAVIESTASELAITQKALRHTLAHIDNAFLRLEESPYDFFFSQQESK